MTNFVEEILEQLKNSEQLLTMVISGLTLCIEMLNELYKLNTLKYYFIIFVFVLFLLNHIIIHSSIYLSLIKKCFAV